MKLKIILGLALVLTGGLFTLLGCDSSKPSVCLESCPPPTLSEFKQMHADSDYQFGFAADGTQTDVLVCSQKWRQWKRISKISLENAKLGHQPKAAQIYMDVSRIYKGKDYAPLPLRTSMDGTGGLVIEPDKIDFDANRRVYLILFNSSWHDDTITTRLEIKKKDLDDAFER